MRASSPLSGKLAHLGAAAESPAPPSRESPPFNALLFHFNLRHARFSPSAWPLGSACRSLPINTLNFARHQRCASAASSAATGSPPAATAALTSGPLRIRLINLARRSSLQLRVQLPAKSVPPRQSAPPSAAPLPLPPPPTAYPDSPAPARRVIMPPLRFDTSPNCISPFADRGLDHLARRRVTNRQSRPAASAENATALRQRLNNKSLPQQLMSPAALCSQSHETNQMFGVQSGCPFVVHPFRLPDSEPMPQLTRRYRLIRNHPIRTQHAHPPRQRLPRPRIRNQAPPNHSQSAALAASRPSAALNRHRIRHDPSKSHPPQSPGTYPNPFPRIPRGLERRSRTSLAHALALGLQILSGTH